MADTALHPALDQRAALHRIVLIIFERLLDRFGDDDRPREMDDRADAVLLDHPRHQRLVADVALDERRRIRDGPAEAGAKVVDHHHFAPGVEQRKHRMAADIAGAAGDEHGGLVHLSSSLTEP